MNTITDSIQICLQGDEIKVFMDVVFTFLFNAFVIGVTIGSKRRKVKGSRKRTPKILRTFKSR